MSSPDSSFLGIHGTALALREQRLQVLAANIANADTPGFRARDMDFTQALNAAMAPGAGVGGDRTRSIWSTHWHHVHGALENVCRA